MNVARHVIIAGYGLPGRSVAEHLAAERVPFVVIERNPLTVTRCQGGGTRIIQGDARDAETLRRSGIAKATTLVVAIPDEIAMLDVVEQARRLRADLFICARCTFVSTGMEATRRGANEVIIAERVVADAMTLSVRRFNEGLARAREAGQSGAG